MPVSNQNMGYDPREMLATFYQQQNEAMGNYQNPSYAMQRGGPMGFDVLPPQPGQQRPMPMPQPQAMPMMPQPQAMPMMPQPQSDMASKQQGRWQMGDDGRLFDPNTGQHKIVAKPKNATMMGGLPFGGYRANGGPVQPGRAYIVGERGPEIMVPQAPGTIVPNTGAMASPSNRPYAELAGGTGSLANRGTRPVGRSGMSADRLNEQAIRRLKSQGDIVGAARLANSNAWLDARLGGPAMRAPQPMPLMPMNAGGQPLPASMPMPSAPMGGFEDMADPSTMPAPAAPLEPSAPPTFEQAFNASPLAGAGPAPMSQPVQPMQVPAGTFAQMPGLNQGAFKGAYVEAPPLVGSAPIPGTDQMQPMVKGEPKGAPVNRTQPPKPAAWEAPKMYDETIPEVRDANGNVTRPAQTRQYYFVQDPQTGKPRKEYALDANGDGVPDNAAGQQPGWMGWLQSQK